MSAAWIWGTIAGVLGIGLAQACVQWWLNFRLYKLWKNAYDELSSEYSAAFMEAAEICRGGSVEDVPR